MNVKCLFLVLCLNFLSACIVDSDLPLPQGKEEIVVNGILNPDSLIKVQLSRTRPLSSDKSFGVIEDAIIKLFENNILIDTLDYSGEGYYFSNRMPKETNRYKIIITGPEIEADIEAEDVVPSRPQYNVCFEQTKDQPSLDLYDVTVSLKFLNLMSDQFHPWIEFISHDYKYDYRGYDTTSLIITKFSYINTYSPYLDDFNATFDNSYGFNEYAFYIRLGDAFSNTSTLDVDIHGGIGLGNSSSRLFRYDVITNLTKDQALFVTIYNCSPAYDRYLKSTIMDFLNNEFLGTPLPFSGPTKIFSNIKNGTGIFAAYSPKSIRVDQFKCN